MVGLRDRHHGGLRGPVPVSTEGRIVGVVLIVVGIGVVGAVIASVTSWILGRVEAERDERRLTES